MSIENPFENSPSEEEIEMKEENAESPDVSRRSFLKKFGMASIAVLAGLGGTAEAADKKKEKHVDLPLGYSDEQLLKLGYSKEDISLSRKQNLRTPPLGYTDEQLRKQGFSEEEIKRRNDGIKH